MKAFRVSGSFQMGRNWQPFTKEVVSDDEKQARERLLSDFGSRHGVKRQQVEIKNITELKGDEVTDPVVKGLLGG